MGLLDSVLGFFGADEQTDEVLRDPKLEDVEPLKRPLTSGPQDRYVATDELGNKTYETVTGQRYTLRTDPTTQPTKGLIRGAVDLGYAAVDAAQNIDPSKLRLPTDDELGTAIMGAGGMAKDAVVGAYDTVERTMAGQGTYQDLIDTTGMVAGVGALGSKPEGALGIFLGRNAPKVDKAALARAEQMEAQGVDRDTIWADTGWGRLNGEWITEIDDSRSMTAGLQPFRDKGTAQTVTRTVPLAKDERRERTLAAQQFALAIKRQIDSGTISPEKGKELAEQIQKQLKLDLANGVEITETVNKPTTPLKKKGLLNEVLGHPEFFDAINDPSVTYTMPSAEAGYQANPLPAPNNRAYGVHYPQSYTEDELKKIGVSRISAFTGAGNETAVRSQGVDPGSSYTDTRGIADKKIFEDFRDGKITAAEAGADLIWSTMLHETQHFSDAIFKSEGRGFNSRSSSDVIKMATKDYNAEKDAVLASQEFTDAKSFLKTNAGVGNVDATKRLVSSVQAYNQRITDGVLKPDEALGQLRLDVERYLGVDATKADVVARDVLSSDAMKSLVSKYDEIEDGTAARLLKTRTKFLLNDPEWEIYIRELGEAKARLVQSRRSMSAAERRATGPWKNLDVNEKELFFGERIRGGANGNPFKSDVNKQTDDLLGPQ